MASSMHWKIVGEPFLWSFLESLFLCLGRLRADRLNYPRLHTDFTPTKFFNQAEAEMIIQISRVLFMFIFRERDRGERERERERERESMRDSESSVSENPEVELEDDSTRFDKSLQELKDLCSQLHYAADYCEKSFLNAKHVQKKKVMENTKEYLCRAVVTVVDHLGSASANLDHQLSKDNAVSETEFRINGLNQRLVTWQQYNHKLALTKLCWNANFPRYHPRYIFPPMLHLERSKEVSRKSMTSIAAKAISKHEFEAEEEVPLFLYTCNHKPSLTKDSIMDTDDEASSVSVLPVRDSLSLIPKARNPSFHFEGTRKLKRNMLNWKAMQSSDILSLVRRRKQAM